ncbi:hypothetical protein VPNG_08249 [Cytospora leucostoma]|uniref:Rhodopsin domain-containing protein n=1 Tax=Cytospora leucostoma TaxID=1230097 RepID=A0A423W786_9PEZI|nr:hypothetical protein VPNG_08249 [Cytospora leucostoma]
MVDHGFGRHVSTLQASEKVYLSKMNWIGAAVPSVVIDIIILILPLPKLWHLKINTARKIGLMTVFILGYCVVIMSIGRLVAVVTSLEAVQADSSYALIPTYYWASAELINAVHRDVYPLLDPSNPALAASGKTVLITGVSGGVGKAIAEAWAIAGARAIVITGRKVDLLDAVAERLRGITAAAYTKVFVHAADLRSDKNVEQLWTKALADVGPS